MNKKNKTPDLNTRFKKGHIPHNKGKKMSSFASEETIKLFLQNSFKKGNIPHNTKSDGIITIRKDQRGIPQKFIRISQNKWEFLSRYNYKKSFGEIPPGMIVAFKDKNTLNCDPENLMLLTRRENMLRNSIVNYPPELVSTIHVLSKLKKRIHGKEQIKRPERSSVRNNRNVKR